MLSIHTDIETSFDFLSIDMELVEAEVANIVSTSTQQTPKRTSLVREEVDQAWNNLYKLYH